MLIFEYIKGILPYSLRLSQRVYELYSMNTTLSNTKCWTPIPALLIILDTDTRPSYNMIL